MKRMKKIFAVILSLAMVLGMSMTAFATEPVTNDGGIKVTGLKKENTKVSIYKVASLATDKNSWDIVDWAEDVIGEIDEDSNAYSFNAETINTARLATVPSVSADETDTKNAGEVTFTGLEEGVYLVIAETVDTNSQTTYNPMLAVTYKYGSDNLITGQTANIVAKSENIKVDKSTNNKFAGVGVTVPFEINTTFPSFHNEKGQNTSGKYKIKDTPTGLKIDVDSIEVYVNNMESKLTSGYTANVDTTSGIMTIVFNTDYIGSNNEHAGAAVKIKYNAVVTEPTGVKNTAQAITDDKDNDPIGTDEEEVFEGNITVTKYAENGTTQLTGAEFSVYAGKKETKNVEGVDTLVYSKAENAEAIKFVKVEEKTDEYRVANEKDILDDEGKEENQKKVTTTVIAAGGTVKVTGLDEGDYFFEETKAPEGYSINKAGTGATITANESADVSVTDCSIKDTKLAGLPSTGGIGTTIFTIGGCAIMIIAAALFFASRRKSAK